MKLKPKLVGFAIIAIALLVAGEIAHKKIFRVSETELVILLEDGDPLRIIDEPGFHTKDMSQEIVKYQKVPVKLRPPSETLIASDQKALLVESLARYRITDPLRFFEVDRKRDIKKLLAGIVNATLRRELGYIKIETLRSDRPGAVEAPLADKANYNAKRFGVEFVDILVRCAEPERCAAAASG